MKQKTEAIWTEFSDRLKSFITHRVSNQSDAEDILQEVFIKIHSRIDTLKDDTRIQGWIYQIARNTIIDYYRNKRVPPEGPAEVIQEFDEFAEDSPAQEIASGLKGLVEKLPAKYAQALTLTEFQELTQKELSQKLGISISGVKSRVQRARTMVKDSLMRCCHFEFDRYGTIIDYHPITCCCCIETTEE